METITGVVNKIVFSTEESDFKIFSLVYDGNKRINVKGDFPNLLVGSTLKVHGNFYTHNKYGNGFRAISHTYSYNNSVRSISLYIQSIAKWLGPHRSHAIAEKFGSNIESIIYDDPDKLTEVEGIGSKVAQSLVDAWIDNRELASIRIFLHSLNLPEKKIKRIINRYGINTEEKLKENPYLLTDDGFTFSSCDFIASKLKIDPNSPMRYKYFIIYTLKQCLYTGHLYLTKKDITKAFNKFNSTAEFPFGNKLRVDDNLIDSYLKDLCTGGYLFREGDRYYEIESFFFENESARKLSLINKEEDKSNLKNIDPDDFIKRYQEEQSTSTRSFELSSRQKEAVRSFIKEKILVITGTPGTGKTTVVKSFVQLMNENGVRFELLTPTGISAKKLGDTAGEEAMTIHRRLGYQGADWRYNAEDKYDTDVVIVDELSMVDMEVFYRLVTAMRDTTRLVFVGDQNQLPSVGPGNVLKELISCSRIKVIHLNKIFRQDECSDIILAADRIKNGDTNLEYFSSDKNSDIWHIQENNPTKIENIIKKFSDQLKHKRKSFQIFSPRNSGPLSVDTLNVALQESLNPAADDKKEVQLNRAVVRKGDRVIITKNNYQLDVFNGDIGKVTFITPEEVCVDIENPGGSSKRIKIPMDIADSHIKLAYAITVHKSQGQEYPLILMPFIKAHGRMLLQRNLLYTAITRAKKKVIIIGELSAVERAIMNDAIQKRNTLFGDRINMWYDGKGKTLRELFKNADEHSNNTNLKTLINKEV